LNVAVKLGDRIEFDGRTYIVRGFAPGRNAEQLVLLEDVEQPTTTIAVPLARLEPSDRPNGPRMQNRA
jgi:hypothetical protein